jgi:cytoskeletal protein RodZ
MNLGDTGFGDDIETEEGAPPGESSNRMFIIVAGVLGGIALLALICIAVYAMVLLPQRRDAQATQKAMVDSQNTEVALIISQTSDAAALAATKAAYTATPTATRIPNTPTPTSSPTSVVAALPGEATLAPAVLTEGAKATELHATLTANALIFGQTATAGALTPTELAGTGFADEVGLPILLGVAVLLLVVIFLARRLRSA